MPNITKEKSKFIITLNNGKQTYFDFADENYYGLNGRKVKGFNKEAMQILDKNSEKNFLAWFFYYRNNQYYQARFWSPAMVETIYTLYSSFCSFATLKTIADTCYSIPLKLDKNGVRAINTILSQNPERAAHSCYTWGISFQSALHHTLHPEFSTDLKKIYCFASPDLRDVINENSKKIMFYMEHENWCGVFSGDFTALTNKLETYIAMTKALKKEPIWKNLFLQIGYTAREYALQECELNKEYQLSAPLFFEDDDFITIIPTNRKEFQQEADEQHNCVYSMYYEKVCKRLTHIIFVRRKNEPKKSYITCEVDNNGNIIQYLERFNKEVKDVDARFFKRAYQQYLYSKF